MNTAPPLTPAQRFVAGVEWLDANQPGWWERIDLDRFSIDNFTDCILGQLYGHYYSAPESVCDQGVHLGFMPHYGRSYDDSAALTTLWVDEIINREQGEA